jgi:hypothetical protein
MTGVSIHITTIRFYSPIYYGSYGNPYSGYSNPKYLNNSNLSGPRMYNLNTYDTPPARPLILTQNWVTIITCLRGHSTPTPAPTEVVS